MEANTGKRRPEDCGGEGRVVHHTAQAPVDVAPPDADAAGHDPEGPLRAHSIQRVAPVVLSPPGGTSAETDSVAITGAPSTQEQENGIDVGPAILLESNWSLAMTRARAEATKIGKPVSRWSPAELQDAISSLRSCVGPQQDARTIKWMLSIHFPEV